MLQKLKHVTTIVVVDIVIAVDIFFDTLMWNCLYHWNRHCTRTLDN